MSNLIRAAWYKQPETNKKTSELCKIYLSNGMAISSLQLDGLQVPPR